MLIWAQAFGFNFVAYGNTRDPIRAQLQAMKDFVYHNIRVEWQEINQGSQSQFYVRLFGNGKTKVAEELQVWLGAQGIKEFETSWGQNPSENSDFGFGSGGY